MKNSLKKGIALSIIPQIILVKILSNAPNFVENYYSKGLYPIVSQFFRSLTGWIPFSVGDIIYATLILLSLRYLVIKRHYIKDHPMNFIRNVFVVLAVAHFTFYFMWGLNYFRIPLGETLALKEEYSEQELLQVASSLIKRTNKLNLELNQDTLEMVEIPYTQQEIFDKTLGGYELLEKEIPFLRYKRTSIKKSLFSTLLTYMGYGGYLNPFTNEAQVNARIPNFRFPVVAGHEIGHQLGYSAENEVNFIGYLVTAKNEDPYIQYAASAYALGYCLNELQVKNEEKFNELYGEINSGVIKNYEEMNAFWLSYENPLEPVFKQIFNIFLKANDQEEGIQSYNEVVALIVAYHKKDSM
jgi:hypothetical protein